MENQASFDNESVVSDLGRVLIAARESKGYSVEDIAASLKLRPRQIAALEAGEFDKLAGPTYIRGMIRNYAKLVDIDPEPLLVGIEQPAEQSVETFKSSCFSTDALSAIDDARTRLRMNSLSWRPNRLLIILAVLAVIFGLLVWAVPQEGFTGLSNFVAAQSAKVKTWWQASHPTDDADAEQVAEATEMAIADGVDAMPTAFLEAEPAMAGSKTPDEEKNSLMGRAVSSPSPSLQANLKMVFREDAWIEIKEVQSRKVVYSGLIRAGTERDFSAVLPITLRIGNAEAVALDFNGMAVGLSSYTRDGVARLLLQ